MGGEWKIRKGNEGMWKVKEEGAIVDRAVK